ncbi:DNA mismatch repair protein Mlh1 [Anopheles arabiensis]|uniref:DNA mismatch repair protein S5 domain-containing protein n=1 Tax=Anopheles arabiensis TaxID=7173 RepID=A0A182HPU5_ANOAR|nr:DNA mismatch repair protein Mlh1 [Anopheles arabiensis]
MDPGVIRKLDEVVVNRIAAGEIIQRPANALKEMIENSLDAKATSITITVKAGGLRSLQIQDNGTGIRREDLGIVCERFTTSKLQSFDDLSSISTYGFRGEALASISHVAHLTIVTKTKHEKCAYKACYEDGKLKGDIKPIAGNQGTQITVDELFYNVPMRKQALKTPNEEFQRISDVVSRYAVHNPHACFILKKFGETATIRTQAKTTVAHNIGAIYGAGIGKALVPIELRDEVMQLTVEGYVTNVNFSLKKGISLMFINHRAVECSALKKAIDAIYAVYLPKGSAPFVYLSLELNPQNVDVNVHPTKHEVHFLHEEEIVEKVKLLVERALLGGNAARSYTQALLPGATQPLDSSKVNESMVGGGDEKPRLDYKFVRTSHSVQKLEKFFNISGSGAGSSAGGGVPMKEEPQDEVVEPKLTQPSPSRKKKVVKRETRLHSIHTLRQQVESDGDENLRKIFRELTYVGTIDREQVLIQYDTKMYLSKVQPIAEELFYQLLLFNFGNFERLTLSEPLDLKRLVHAGLDDPASGYTEEDGPADELADVIVQKLVSKAPVLREYYNLSIREDGFLESLPKLLDNYITSLVFLPMYVIRLATDVEWEEEQECFRTFSRETAHFFSRIALTKPEKEYRWELEHVLYPAVRNYLIPPKEMAKNGSLLQLASLPELYRVFERC